MRNFDFLNYKTIPIMKKTALFLSALFAILLYQSCSKHSHESTPCSTSNTTTVSYARDIAPLMAASCSQSGCHSIASKAGGHQFTNLAGIKEALDHGHFYSEMSSGQMPPSGKLPDSTLAKVKSWVDACGPDN